jgi:hypothetical protein
MLCQHIEWLFFNVLFLDALKLLANDLISINE